MNVGTRSPALAALVLILMAAPGWARAEGDAAPAAPASSAASSSPVSATGLLPIFGVGLDMDALPPGASPEDAVASVQKLWDKYLKSAGFNVIQFPVEVKELGDQGAGRLAKLCVWAKANDVRLAPLLVGAPAGEALPGDYPDRVGAFAAKTIELVGKAGDPQAYSENVSEMMYSLCTMNCGGIDRIWNSAYPANMGGVLVTSWAPATLNRSYSQMSCDGNSNALAQGWSFR